MKSVRSIVGLGLDFRVLEHKAGNLCTAPPTDFQLLFVNQRALYMVVNYEE